MILFVPLPPYTKNRSPKAINKVSSILIKNDNKVIKDVKKNDKNQ